jgi:hypothetical protein
MEARDQARKAKAKAKGSLNGKPYPEMPTELSAEELHAQISEAAYFLAEQRGFEPGYEERDWLAAEAQVKARLAIRNEGPDEEASNARVASRVLSIAPRP